MTPIRTRGAILLLLALLLAACQRQSYFEPPEVQGYPLMVADGDAPRLFVLVKQEEQREYRFSGGARRNSGSRIDTYFHFELRVYDPLTAKPLWRRRLLTIGDPDAKTAIRATKIVGSAESGYLLGHAGDRVWLVIADAPYAVSVADGTLLAGPETLEQANPALQGRLPSEARHYGFDDGLVLLAADAQRWVVRGPDAKAEAYSPPAPVVEPAPLKANGMPRIVPLRPLGDAPQRQIVLGERHLGLYSAREAEDAARDDRGDHLAYPYSIIDEGATARRTFWTVRTADVERWEEKYRRIEALEPIPGAPTFLRGRFVKRLPGDEPLRVQDPDGMLVWHSTRMDDAGRLALTRLDGSLDTVWTAELPLSESGTANPVMYWRFDDRIAVFGGLRTEEQYVVGRALNLVGVRIADGHVQAHDLTAEPTDPRDPERVP
jgi:hypothetical protein